MDHLSPPCQVVYLGISGVLHPSESTYELVNLKSPWSNGHARYESVPVLEAALQDWPRARIVLTSTLPWRDGLEATVKHLGSGLASRVLGFTYEDMTTKVKRAVRSHRTGTTQLVGNSDEDYWRMDKAHIVVTHAAWLKPASWVAIDDEDIRWPKDVREDRLVLTDGCEGLWEPAAQERLRVVLAANFGDGAR